MENKNKMTENPDVMELSDDVLDQVTGGTGITLEKAGSTMQISTKGGPVRIIVPDEARTSTTQTNVQAAAEKVLHSFEAQIESHSTSLNEIGRNEGYVNAGAIVEVSTNHTPYFVYYEADNGSVEKFSTNIP